MEDLVTHSPHSCAYVFELAFKARTCFSIAPSKWGHFDKLSTKFVYSLCCLLQWSRICLQRNVSFILAKFCMCFPIECFLTLNVIMLKLSPPWYAWEYGFTCFTLVTLFWMWDHIPESESNVFISKTCTLMQQCAHVGIHQNVLFMQDIWRT